MGLAKTVREYDRDKFEKACSKLGDGGYVLAYVNTHSVLGPGGHGHNVIWVAVFVVPALLPGRQAGCNLT